MLTPPPPSNSPLEQQLPELESSIMLPLDAAEGLDAANFFDSFWSPLTLSLAGLLLLLLMLAALYLTRKKSKEAPAPSAQEIAMAALQALAEDSKRLSSRPQLSIALSLILREYITHETQDPALFETHQEFSQRFDALSHLAIKSKRATHLLLEKLADYKYAGEYALSLEESHQAIEETRALITRIEEERAAAAAATPTKP